MLADIRYRHLNYWEVFQCGLLVYKRNLYFIFAISLLTFISWHIFTYDILESDFGIVINLFYSLIVYPFVFISFSYIIQSYMDSSNILYDDIWRLCWIKLPKTINVQIIFLPYVVGMLLVTLLLVILLNIILPLLKINFLLLSLYSSGLIIVIFCLGLFIMAYFAQHSLHAVVINNKRSYEALKHSFKLVKNNPWESLLIIGISLTGLFGTEFVSSAILNNLPIFMKGELFSWIIAFKFEMLASFFAIVNIISYLNIDCAYQRQNSNS